MGRNTRQRRAIADVFSRIDRPLRPEEVLESARESVPSMGIATVYRNLARLLQSGEIVGVNLPDVGTLYERAGKAHHHHFYCRQCGRLFDFPGCPVSDDHLVPPGFLVDGHELFLYGTCEDCRK